MDEQGRHDSVQLGRAGDVPIPPEDFMGSRCREEQLFWHRGNQEHHKKLLEAAAAFPAPAKQENLHRL